MQAADAGHLPHTQVLEVQEALRDTPHNGFPVVRDTSCGQVFIGTITRGHLTALLQKMLTARRQRESSSTNVPLPEVGGSASCCGAACLMRHQRLPCRLLCCGCC